ncbi:MAG: type I restriction enzyme HsdR N-terminal domain-containing protein [Bacteroidetes bacterium]|nr:type I restriction enzyme HsdR N-terminal domain-containing protein [Bacteroidota bacterium]
MQNKNIKQELFGDIDFSAIANDDNFKEDSVREIIVMPIIKKLGYTDEHIVRSKTLEHPFLKVGSNRNVPIKLIPDYAIKIGEFYAWVLDAKSPKQKIINDDNVSQVYCYASHPEIRSRYFVLCNGIEFAVYETNGRNIPVLYFRMEDIESNWKLLEKYLSINSSKTDSDIIYQKIIVKHQQDFDYLNRPLLKEIPIKKQAAKRHFGVHGYFTRQAWNVVQKYIKNYTQPGDLVLDPFGGSGITAVEALMTERKAINIDLNPFAVFLVDSLIAPVSTDELANAFENVKKEYLKKEPKTKKDIAITLKKHKGCKVLHLPKGSGVPTTDKLFSKEQMAKLSLLKSIIKKQKNKNIKKTLMLMFSGLVTKTNLTYHSSTSRGRNAGNTSAFQYYGYRIAPNPSNITELMPNFELRYKRISAAKKDIEYYINKDTIENIKNIKGTATDLNFIEDESVDYIYTDPPYGKNIAYLDLSMMWNAWLDLEVTEKDYKLEAIEGGNLNKSKDEYKDLIAKSIKEMYRVLKFDRWLSFVFAHKDPAFWHIIVDTAESCGFEYAGAVSQNNGQTSFKKRKNPFTVLSGQIIINFKKVRKPKVLAKAKLGMKTFDILMQTIEGIIAKNDGATIEQINDAIIITGLEIPGFFFDLRNEYDDVTPILRDNFDYDFNTEKYFMRKNTRFTTHIDINDRVKHYLLIYLKTKNRENINPNFDDLVKYVMPLLKNGKTPETQTILDVLKTIATQVGKDGWKLANGELF